MQPPRRTAIGPSPASPVRADASAAASGSVRAGTSAPLRAQRLWLLERPAVSDAARNVCRFAGAVAVVAETCVYVLVVMASDARRASDVPVREGRLRPAFDRDAARFVTLDGAVAWAEREKAERLHRGWTEISPDIAAP